jgi:hypothetical protein
VGQIGIRNNLEIVWIFLASLEKKCYIYTVTIDNHNQTKSFLMTELQAIKFAAQIQIGTRIAGYGGQVMIVTAITDKYIKGISEYAQKKFGKESEMILEYTTLLNPHYNKSLQIL